MQINSSSQPTTNHPNQQLAVQCSHCLDHLAVPVYVDLPPTSHPGRVSTKATRCPRCHNTRQYRQYDYSDCLVNDYFGLTRKGALDVVAQFNELSAQGRLPSTPNHGRPKDPIELISITWGFKRLLSRSAITPLTVQCKDCAGSYTVLRTSPDLTVTPTLYCVYCGSNKTTLVQDSTEETAWITLAHHYALSVQAVQFFFKDWTASSTHPTFAAYLSSDTVAPLVAAAQQSTQVSSRS